MVRENRSEETGTRSEAPDGASDETGQSEVSLLNSRERGGSGRLNLAEKSAWEGFLFTYARVLKSLDQAVDQAERLPLSSYEVLLKLSEADGNQMRMKDIAASLLVSRSGLTRVVDDLERRGLVERRRCPTDARGFDAVLTAAGRRVFRRAEKVFLRHLRTVFLGKLSDEQLAALDGIWESVGFAEPEPGGAEA
jgi:DNA-binding MarR family transcriptional regulator